MARAGAGTARRTGRLGGPQPWPIEIWFFYWKIETKTNETTNENERKFVWLRFFGVPWLSRYCKNPIYRPQKISGKKNIDILISDPKIPIFNIGILWVHIDIVRPMQTWNILFSIAILVHRWGWNINIEYWLPEKKYCPSSERAIFFLPNIFFGQYIGFLQYRESQGLVRGRWH